MNIPEALLNYKTGRRRGEDPPDLLTVLCQLIRRSCHT